MIKAVCGWPFFGGCAAPFGILDMPMRQEVAALPEGWSAYQDDEGVDLTFRSQGDRRFTEVRPIMPTLRDGLSDIRPILSGSERIDLR